MGNVGVCRWRVFAAWVVVVALFAGALGGAVLLPAEAATAQGSAPAATGRVADVELTVGDAARIVAAGDYFTGTGVSYSATSADTAVVSVSASGSTVTLTPRGAGSTTVTVTATNSAGSATQTFTTKVLPAGCVVTLGTLTGGRIVTETGAWASDDGCRATNATSAAHNHYARYVSFTVSEPLEARIRLSSPQGKRLYLLEGSGTGGRIIDSAGTSSTTSAASFWESLQPGTYTLETTTYYAAREADFTLSIDSMPLVPPDSCVVSLGTITAGTILTETGSWDRDDWCRSTNATTNQSYRHYADYLSFTVTEPLEAWFRLSSTQGKRLYLLEGEGTGGRVIASESTSSTTAAASEWEALRPGTYTIEVTTYSRAREADYTLTIDSMPLVPPASCVVSVGTLTAGTITTETGAWDRDDWCRSTNATTSQSARYYADYVSFTVTEPLEAWFRLSSTQGKRLYLLEGEGTGGRVIASESTSSTTAAASEWEALQPGTYTIEVTTYSRAREADYTLTIDSMPLVPPASCVVSVGTLTAGTILTEEGSWDRDDWCRSTNATTSQSARYYADYVSFTVTEPLEARVTLSSDQSVRWYLLDGAGTGGRVLNSVGTSRALTTRSLWRVYQPGTYTIETTTYSRAVEAEYTLSIDSMPLVPPDYCVTSLGTLTAGTVTTEEGSWDRDDWCRSTNATTSQSSRYYADYVSFTVTEPLEARVTLSSDQSVRWYLLDGAGTGGRVLNSVGTSRALTTRSLWRVYQPGTYTIETTTYSRAVEAEYTLSIDSMPLVPPDYCVVSLGTLTAGTVLTESGSWDRDDWCRSTNATTSQSSRYYADYVSFTVTEPLEARVTLSSDQSVRWYLLDGAGTGGRVLNSVGTSRALTTRSLWRVYQPGTYTIETTTYSRAVEAEYTLSIDSMPLVPPDYCVTSLGTLTAGTITTESGSWDRDDWCRSTNATTSQTARYYADYVSFTVTEALEARFRLTSDSRARLYLLNGNGAAGALITSAGHRRSTSNPSLRRVLQPGTYTLETAAYSATVEDDFTLSVSLAVLAPTRGDALEAQVIEARPSAARVDVSGAFNGTVESYAATSSNASILTTSVAGSVVTLHGVAVGNARVTVTATNAAGSTTQSFAVTVRPVAAPQATGTLAAQTLAAAASVEVDVVAAFAGSVDTYRATSGDTTVATVSTTGSVLTLVGVAAGTATITVVATNTGGTAQQSLTVTVTAAAPQAVGTLDAQTLPAGASAEVDVAAAFAGTVTTYRATSSDTTIATVTTAGSVVTLNGVAEGQAIITVVATNTAGRATQSFTVTVAPPPPTAVGTLDAQTLTAAVSVEVDVAAAFAGTVTTYGATSSDTTIATVTTTDSTLTLVGVAAGRATITVVATNTAGTATQTIAVTVNPPAPTATAEGLAAQTLTAGESVDVDIAAAFAGTVDTYTATSSNGAVVDIALTGSTLTLVGVAAGTATVTVIAANAAGSATQTVAVTVNLPPAPTLGAALAAQTLQATGTLTIDIAAGFNGQIDTYEAVSGNTNTITATTSGSEITLTGIAVGSTTVTVTAINAAGRAARSFTVTVTALTAPQTAATPLARTIAVGEELPINIADAFSGIVHTYTATSTTTATATADGPVVTLTGAAAGTTTITLVATNTAGSATQTLPVTVQAPEQLTIAVAAPSHCLGSEGTLAPGGGRRGVGHINVTYHIAGGAPPYTITSPDTPQTANTPTGTLTITCAQRGIDLTTAAPTTNVVEAGPRTLTITATDNTNTTTTTNIEIETAENAYTTEYNGGQMHPANTYILGTPDQWVLITLPPGLTLQFEGLSQGRLAYFTEPTTGTELVLDWTTGTEISRTTPTRTTTRTATKNVDTTTTTTAPTITTRLNRLTIIKRPDLTHGADSTEWRPYAGLPLSNTFEGKTYGVLVAVHPKVLIGEEIRVCTEVSDQEFKDHVTASMNAWNGSVNDPTTGYNPSFPRNLFTFDEVCSSDSDVEFQIAAPPDIVDKHCGIDTGGCIDFPVTGTNPPMLRGRQTIYISDDYERVEYVMIHELGHALGLGDYGYANDDKCEDENGLVLPTRPYFASVMAGGDCEEGSVQLRDLAALHLIYHPYARTNMHFEAVGATGWALNPGDPPRDTGREVAKGVAGIGVYSVWEYRYVSNAAGYVVLQRAVGSTGGYHLVGKFGRSESRLLPGAQLQLGPGRDGIEGKEFYVVGVTRGDIEQSTSTYLEVHATLPFDLGILTTSLGFAEPLGPLDWTFGHGATVYGPPAMPTNILITLGNREVGVAWPHVAGATDYDVYRHDTAEAIKQPTTTDGDPDFREKRNVHASTRTSCGLRVTFDGLENSSTYYFRVRANRDDVELRGRLSAEVSGRPHAGLRPRGSSADLSGGAGKAASEPPEDSCTPPAEVDPVEGDPECPSGDGFSWVLREVVGGVWWCDRLDVAGVVSTTVERCDVAGDELRVGAGGVRVCERVVSGTVRSRPGDPVCEEGYELVTTVTPVGGVQVCSMTDTEPATASAAYSCDEEDGWSLVNLGVPFCSKRVTRPATPVTSYECDEDYTFVPGPVGGGYCRKVLSVAATPSAAYSCDDGWSLVNLGVPFCSKRVTRPATPVTRYECPLGYSFVAGPIGGGYCRKVLSVAATPSVSYSCDDGWSLVNLGTPFCSKRVTRPATARTSYECRSGYSFVPGPIGGGYCRKVLTVAATATYSCPSGYTLSGTSCYKYLYASPTDGTCPTGYTPYFNGFAHLCRKKVTTTATVTYSCPTGYSLSGTTCSKTLTASPTVTTTYHCPTGYSLSGTTCSKTLTASPTVTTTYHCPTGYSLSGTTCSKTLTASPTVTTTYHCPTGYSLSGTTCSKTLTTSPNVTTTYHCNNAPPGYRLSGQNCVKTLTASPTVTTTYRCDTGYTLSGTTCSKTLTTSPNVTTTYHCNDAPPGYTLNPDDNTCSRTTTKQPTRPTIHYCDTGYTLNADDNTCSQTTTTTPTTITTNTCPATPPDEPPYTPTTTTTATTTTTTCTRTITIPAETGPPTCPAGYNPVLNLGEDGITLTSCTLNRDTTSNLLDP